MDQILLLESVERYLRNEMNAEERLQFENLRKANPELDQLVVEHHFFLDEMDRYGEIKRLKANLYDTHHTLQENGDIKDVTPDVKGRLVNLWERYRRVIAVAASIAGITALLITGIITVITPKAPVRDVEELSRKVSNLEKKTNTQTREINDVKKKIEPGTPIQFGGSGFIIDGKGYILTSAHVVKGAARLFVQNNKGQDFRAKIIYTDEFKDLAVLKIDDSDYKTVGSLPYGFRKPTTDYTEGAECHRKRER